MSPQALTLLHMSTRVGGDATENIIELRTQTTDSRRELHTGLPHSFHQSLVETVYAAHGLDKGILKDLGPLVRILSHPYPHPASEAFARKVVTSARCS